MTEDEMVGWHHQLNGHEFEQALGDGEGQESLTYCSPLGCRAGHNSRKLACTYAKIRIVLFFRSLV